MEYKVTIEVGVVVADSHEAAMKEAEDLLCDLAGSNDGSEIFANAVPVLESIK